MLRSAEHEVQSPPLMSVSAVRTAVLSAALATQKGNVSGMAKKLSPSELGPFLKTRPFLRRR